jgi:hypothetical protein
MKVLHISFAFSPEVPKDLERFLVEMRIVKNSPTIKNPTDYARHRPCPPEWRSV